MRDVRKRREAAARRAAALAERDPVEVLAATRFADIINRMTNWQRTQWARAGHPGLRGKDATAAAKFLAIVRAG